MEKLIAALAGYILAFLLVAFLLQLTFNYVAAWIMQGWFDTVLSESQQMTYLVSLAVLTLLMIIRSATRGKIDLSVSN